MRAYILVMLLAISALPMMGKCQTCRGTGWVHLNIWGSGSQAFSCMWCDPQGKCPTPIWHLQREHKAEVEQRAKARQWLFPN